ncbi:MAG: GAF domain-containing SpoIIE family protein phosphatase [Mycobacteriales bacterium]
MTAVQDEDEALRMDAVRRYAILDTPPDGAFDRIAATAARLFDVPIAIVSIVDTDRIWFKSHHGIDLSETGRDPGLCASAIMNYAPWIVNDARYDERTLANPLVAGESGLRFYAGAPLTTHDGYNLGTLCVIDAAPRSVTEAEAQTLTDLASLVVDELELRLAARRALAESASRLRDVEQLAEALQTSLLPPALPKMAGIQIAAKYHPANRFEVGGDFYDVFPVDEEWGLVIGDVCGKGPRAAGQASATRYSVRTAALEESSPAAVLRTVNQALLALAEGEEDARFVTAAYARVCAEGDGVMVRFAVGGHPLPTVLRANGAVEALGTPGSLLGVVPEVDVTDTSVELRRGDTLVLVTDGVYDSGYPQRLGLEGFETLLARCAGLSPADIVERVHDAVDKAQRDDIAILAISPQR